MSRPNQWDIQLLLHGPGEIFEICRRVGRLEFVACYAEDAMVHGDYLIVDRLCAPRLDPVGENRACVRQDRKSPCWFRLSEYMVTIRPRPSWAL